MHNMLMIGPAGTGKTMVARRMPTIMPAMDLEECIEISKIYSVSRLLSDQEPLILKRPFRNPHHTVSPQALAGGGGRPRPGEISLASGGILFLDELPEMGREALETLRQPLEERRVTITRLQGAVTYPANFQLVAAMNPCPAGIFRTGAGAAARRPRSGNIWDGFPVRFWTVLISAWRRRRFPMMRSA